MGPILSKTARCTCWEKIKPMRIERLFSYQKSSSVHGELVAVSRLVTGWRTAAARPSPGYPDSFQKPMGDDGNATLSTTNCESTPHRTALYSVDINGVEANACPAAASKL